MADPLEFITDRELDLPSVEATTFPDLYIDLERFRDKATFTTDD